MISNGKLSLITLIALAVVLESMVFAQPAATAVKLLCSDHELDVKLARGETATFKVIGTLCSQGPATGKTIQLLLHGGGTDRFYWDFPYQPDHYSYVRAATRRGYATFNLDRIGNGASDHPDGNSVDIEANTFVVHQVVKALRRGKVASRKFRKVIVVGHSIGSFVAVNYAGSFPGEADGVILTGFLHNLNLDFIQNVVEPAFYPATLDDKFLGQFPNFDYFTTVPGARGAFYQLSHVDHLALELDESLKQTITLGEFITGPPMTSDPISMQITGPVLVVIGEFDHLFCDDEVVNCSDKNAVQDYEKDWYGDSACIETAVIRTSGHSLNLHINAQTAYNRMLSWADRRVGRTMDDPPQPCNAP